MNIPIFDSMDFRVYYIHYLDNLYDLIRSGIFDYSWECMEDIVIQGDDAKSWDGTGNPFLDNNKDNKICLAEDILNRGMYAPFISYRNGISATGKQIYYVVSGSHRAYSLKLLSQKQSLDKKFLFVYFKPYEEQKYETPLPLYTFDEKSPRKMSITNATDIFDVKIMTDYFIGFMNRCFFEQNIQPSPILNNEKLFENFIATGVVI